MNPPRASALVEMRKCVPLLALVVLLTGDVCSAQTRVLGMTVGGAFGPMVLDGSGVPAGGPTTVGAARVSAGRMKGRARVSADFELNWSGVVSGRQGDARNGGLFRERRHDFAWSGLGGVQWWEPRRIGSARILLGVSRAARSVAQTVETADEKTGARTLVSSDSNTLHGWCLTAGADLLIAFGRVAVGPTIRLSQYVTNPFPREPSRSRHLVGGGLAVSYGF
jgi:hypothetical protein